MMDHLIHSAERDKWLSALAASQKTPDVAKAYEKLRSKLDHEISVEPLYNLSNDQHHSPVQKNNQNGWENITRVDCASSSSANAQALHDLNNGADGIIFISTDAGSAYGQGISQLDIECLLDGIDLDAAPIHFDGFGSDEQVAIAQYIDNRVGRNGDSLAKIHVNPIAKLVSAKETHLKLNFYENIKDFQYLSLTSDGTIWHNSGATAVLELALCLAQIVDNLRILEQKGLEENSALNAIGIKLSANVDQFETISKFRAMHLLWQSLLSASGLTVKSPQLHGQTSWRMLSHLDIETNLIRNAIAVFSAGLGGASSITTLPHTLALSKSSDEARRYARNISLVLRDEAHLGFVSDPAIGSGLYEDYTNQLASKAWKLFQEIEKAGGFYKSVKRGLIDGLIQVTRQEHIGKLENGFYDIVGSNKFINPNEPKSLNNSLSPAASTYFGTFPTMRDAFYITGVGE